MNEDQTVFVVDDDPAALESVCALVESMGLQARSFGSAEEFLAASVAHQRGCLVTDVRMLGMSGLELQEKLRSIGSEMPVIVITAFAETPMTVSAMKKGAITLLEKPCSNQVVWDAIREALGRDRENQARSVRRRRIRAQLESLSPQERYVLDQIVAGKQNKEIAQKTDVSVRTIESRRRNVFLKMQAESVAELVRCVLEVEAGDPQESRPSAPHDRPQLDGGQDS